MLGFKLNYFSKGVPVIVFIVHDGKIDILHGAIDNDKHKNLTVKSVIDIHQMSIRRRCDRAISNRCRTDSLCWQ